MVQICPLWFWNGADRWGQPHFGEQRARLVTAIQQLGIQPKHLSEMFGERMAARIGIGWGPSQKGPMPPGKSDAEWVKILQAYVRAPRGPKPNLPQSSQVKAGPREEPTKTKATDKARAEERLEVIYAAAPEAKREIDAIADKIAATVGHGATVAKAPLKGKARALEKVMKDYAGDASKIKDIARNTIVARESDHAEIVKLLGELGANVKVIEGKSDPTGYSGINATYTTRSGLTAEIQVNSPEMIYAKEPEAAARAVLGDATYDAIAAKVRMSGGRGHKLYEEFRSLTKDDTRRDQVAAESRAYYNAVREAVQ